MTAPELNRLPDKRYFRIGEVCEITDLKPHVLRYWETEFRQVKPVKTRTHQRLYRKKDVETILLIKALLYDQKYTIAGAKAKLDAGRGKTAAPEPQAGPKQLAIDFDPAGRDEIIELILAELRGLAQILDNPAE
jgi:DNA-binding transcriptional MerR regulator